MKNMRRARIEPELVRSILSLGTPKGPLFYKYNDMEKCSRLRIRDSGTKLYIYIRAFYMGAQKRGSYNVTFVLLLTPQREGSVSQVH